MCRTNKKHKITIFFLKIATEEFEPRPPNYEPSKLTTAPRRHGFQNILDFILFNKIFKLSTKNDERRVTNFEVEDLCSINTNL